MIVALFLCYQVYLFLEWVSSTLRQWYHRRKRPWYSLIYWLRLLFTLYHMFFCNCLLHTNHTQKCHLSIYWFSFCRSGMLGKTESGYAQVLGRRTVGQSGRWHGHTLITARSLPLVPLTEQLQCGKRQVSSALYLYAVANCRSLNLKWTC